MVKISLIDPADDQGRTVAIDWGPPSGAYIRLTRRQWLDFVREIDSIRESEGWKVVRVQSGQR